MSDGGYSEDFENYDDDGFEAEDDYEVLPKSMMQGSPAPPSPSHQEAARRPSSVGYGQQRPASGYGHRPPSAQLRPLAVPIAPQLSDAEMRAQRKRLAIAKQKMRHVQLQFVAMDDIYVAAPLSEYDLFSMARGVYARCKAAAVQTNDDAKEEEAQTDEVPARSYASQVPDDRTKMTDAEVFAFSVDASARSATSATTAAARVGAAAGHASVRVLSMEAGVEVKLASFMAWAGPQMLAALGMAVAARGLLFAPDPRGGQGLSGGLLHLGWEPLLAHRPVTAVTFSPSPTEPLLLAAYGPVGAQLGAGELIKDHTFATKGVLCVWDLSAPTQPLHVLTSEGAPTCACFAPSPAHHVIFAGMAEGGVCAWDVEEPAGRHPREELGGGKWVAARRPSYTTEGCGEAGIAGPVVSVAAAAKEGGGRSTPCTLVALGAWGEVSVFTVSLLAGAEGSAADVDLGMRIGSRVRLLRHAGTVRLGTAALAPPGVLPMPVPTHCLALLTGARERGQLVAGSCGGRVLRGSWVGTPPAPKEFIADDHKSAAAVSSAAAASIIGNITALAASPFHPQAFLSGTSAGCVSLHATSAGPAVLLWPEVAAGGVAALTWSPTRPAAFLVLDGACNVHYFDLMQSLSSPVASEPFMAAQGGGGIASLPTTLASAALQPGGKSTEATPSIALGYDDGGVDVHALGHRYGVSSVGHAAEVGKLVEVLGVAPAMAAAAT